MRWLIVVGCAVVSAGCSSDREVATGMAGADTLRLSIEWEVAPGVHPAADSIGDVSGVAVDGNGNVYVTDRLAAKIWVFDRDGRFQLAIGRKGQGPGEFEAPTGSRVGPDERLYVRDVYRVTVFGPDPTSGLLSHLETSFDGPTYADWASKRATRFDSTGAMLYPGNRWNDDGTAAPYVFRFAAGELTDSIFVPTYANAPQLTAHYRTGPHGGRMLQGLNYVPFAALPVWDAMGDSKIVSGDGQSYKLIVTGFDGAVWDTIGRPIGLERIPSDERADSARALRTRLDSIPVPLDQVEGMPESVREIDVPVTYPAYRAVYATAEGEIWVRRWIPSTAARSVFDVFAGRTYDRTVVLPRPIQDEPTPYLSRSSVIGVMTDALTGEYIVIQFSVTGAQ